MQVRSRTPSKPETILARGIVESLRDIGLPCERIQSGIHRVKRGYLHCASKGTPDWWTPLTWLEIKMPGEEPTPEQLSWHAAAKRWGVRVDVVSSIEEAGHIARQLLRAHRFEEGMGWK